MLKDQIEQAKESLAKLAETHPELFPQYVNFIHRKLELKELKEEVEKAETIWNNILGKK